MLPKRAIVILGLVLLFAHAAILTILGTKSRGPLVSDLIQLFLGLLVIAACLQASYRCEDVARYFWRFCALANLIWVFGQALGAYSDIFHSSDFTHWLTNLFFCFAFVPLAFCLFLDSTHELKKLDRLVFFDFGQAVLFSIAAYIYFYYLPGSKSDTDLAHSVWAPYFAGYGLVTAAFLVRSLATDSVVVRAFFGRMGLFLCISGLTDAAYYYGPARTMQPGAWFDIIWSILLIIPLLIAASWETTESIYPSETVPIRARALILAQLFPLLYPSLTLMMAVWIGKQKLVWALVIALVSFACSSARFLATQHRLLEVKDALHRQATGDGMTGIWNRGAVLEILKAELLRADRTGTSVGVIMADIDHFKNVNDSFGHAVGDSVIRDVAKVITGAIRPYDSAGRYGGEEFLVIAPGCSMSETKNLAERIRLSTSTYEFACKGNRLHISVSMGVTAGGGAKDLENILHTADAALYRAKILGRNRVESNSLGILEPHPLYV